LFSPLHFYCTRSFSRELQGGVWAPLTEPHFVPIFCSSLVVLPGPTNKVFVCCLSFPYAKSHPFIPYFQFSVLGGSGLVGQWVYLCPFDVPPLVKSLFRTTVVRLFCLRQAWGSPLFFRQTFDNPLCFPFPPWVRSRSSPHWLTAGPFAHRLRVVLVLSPNPFYLFLCFPNESLYFGIYPWSCETNPPSFSRSFPFLPSLSFSPFFPFSFSFSLS